MDKQERLIDQLKDNLKKLDDKQREVFRLSLKRQLPGVIKKAADEAQQTSNNQEDEK